MSTTINPDRLAQLEEIELHHGSHSRFEQGHCAMEVVAWLADEGHTDAPACASPVLRRYVITLNDRWSDEKRQMLKPYLVKMVGTGGDGLDQARERIAMRMLLDRMLEPWIRLAGMPEADTIEGLRSASLDEQRNALYAIRDAAWRLRSERYSELRRVVREKVEERLKDKPAAAVADAVADAVAVAVADAVAVAAADVNAVAAAVANAVAVADAVTVAVADAVAVAVADAVAAANAVADADGKDPWGATYSAAYKAARAYYDANPLPVAQEVADLAASQEGFALELLDAMIAPEPVA